MSTLTKEQLRNELITHGVELPSSTARKGEYVELYEKYVAPVQQSKGDFSSDEEDFSNSTPITQASADLIVGGVDVSQLDDEELYSQLQSRGATLGPIVDTTRRVYQKKLYVLLGGSVEETPTYNGDVDQDEYSESEEEIIEEQPQVLQKVTQQMAEPASPPPAQHIQTTDIRRRLIASPDKDSSELLFDPDLHTPSPRRSLRTVTSSSSETITVRRFVNNGRSEIVQEPTKTEAVVEAEGVGEGGKLYALGRLLVKLIILALLMAAALLAYQYFQNNPSESPFKAVEQMARQALDAAVGEKAAAEPEVAPEDAPAAPEVDNPRESPFKTIEQMAQLALAAVVGEKAAAEEAPEEAAAEEAPEEAAAEEAPEEAAAEEASEEAAAEEAAVEEAPEIAAVEEAAPEEAAAEEAPEIAAVEEAAPEEATEEAAPEEATEEAVPEEAPEIAAGEDTPEEAAAEEAPEEAAAEEAPEEAAAEEAPEEAAAEEAPEEAAAEEAPEVAAAEEAPEVAAAEEAPEVAAAEEAPEVAAAEEAPEVAAAAEEEPEVAPPVSAPEVEPEPVVPPAA